MAERRLEGLQRVLGTNALAASAYGNVGSSIYYALGLVAALALGLTPVVFVIAGAIFYVTALTYAEATAMYPEAGGSSSFARRAFNEAWSFFAAWAQMLNYTITIAISAFAVPHYIGGLFWEPLRSAPADIAGTILVIALLCAINVIGAKESAGLNVFLAILDFCTQLGLVVVGIVLVLSPDTLVSQIHFGTAPSLHDFLIAIPVAMVAYTGIETISNMAEEAKDEEKTIPAAIHRVVIAVFAIYIALPSIALSALPVTKQLDGSYVTKLGLPESQGGFAGDPILGVVKHLHLGPLQGAAEVYVGLLAATILLIATNAGIIGVSRLTYSMGLHRQLPDGMRRLHPRYRTPWVGIVLFGVIACIAVLPGKADFLGNMYAFGAMLSFTIAHLAVIRLRLTEPDHRRPYRGPGVLRIAGRPLPLFAVLGGIGTGLAWLTVTALHLDVAVTGLGWLAFGMVGYTLYRRHIGLDLTTTTKIALPKPVVDHEAEYRSVLVAFDAHTYSPHLMGTAQKLAARRRRGIHVVVLVTVPTALPITARMPGLEQTAHEVLEQAKVQGGRRVTGHLAKVRPGQAGRRLIDEANEMRAQAIVMPLPGRSGGAGSLFGRTLETVLAERPCRVIIESEPTRRGEEALAAARGGRSDRAHAS